MSSDPQRPRHVVVIGAGIVGVATATWLQRAGLRVTLIDREGPAAGASSGNGGVLAASAVVPVTDPGLWRRLPGMLLRRDAPLFLRKRALPGLAPWLLRYAMRANARDARQTAEAMVGLTRDTLTDHQALAEGTPAARRIVPCDYVYLYKDRAAYEDDAFTWQTRAALGIEWQEIEGPALQRRDPLLGHEIGFAAAMGLHGRIDDPGAYVGDLAAAFTAAGGELAIGTAERVLQTDGRVTGLRIDNADLACDAVVLSSGVWSGPLARQMGLDVPLQAERGYHLDLWGPSAVPRDPVMVAAGKFVATPMTGRLRLAGIVEYAARDDPPSAAPVDLLRRQIRRAMPGLTWRSETSWMGSRPTLVDSRPVIGPVQGLAGAWAGFGHGHVGLTSGPRTGRLLAQMICGQRTNIDLSAFSPARFSAPESPASAVQMRRAP